MRSLTIALLAVCASPALASAASFCQILWPDDEIAVPEFVRLYITQECAIHARRSGEGFEPCVRGETGGYRATVMLLSDPELGDRAAERYRACAAGLGAEGGRFHRRRAECIGGSFRILWRFDDAVPS